MLFGSDVPGNLRAVLVTSGGAMYQIPGFPDEPFGNGDLSPDGRWLGWRTGDGYRLRDLTTTTVHAVAVSGQWNATGWSSDGRYAVLTNVSADVTDTRSTPPVRIDLRTGARAEVKVDAGGVFTAVAVLPGGEVLLVARGDRATERITWRAVDPRAGRQRSGVVDVSGVVAPGSTGVHLVGVSPDGRKVAVVEMGPVQGGRDGGSSHAAAVVIADLASGRATARYALPPPDGGETTPVAYRREGILLGLPGQGGHEYQMLSLTDGERTTVCSLALGERANWHTTRDQG